MKYTHRLSLLYKHNGMPQLKQALVKMLTKYPDTKYIWVEDSPKTQHANFTSHKITIIPTHRSLQCHISSEVTNKDHTLLTSLRTTLLQNTAPYRKFYWNAKANFISGLHVNLSFTAI
jgi:hypothetical protein